MNSRSIRAAISAAVHDTDPEIVDAREECSISFELDLIFEISSLFKHVASINIPQILSRQKLLITGFCFDDSKVGADVYDANVKNSLADVTAISKDLPNPTDDEVTLQS